MTGMPSAPQPSPAPLPEVGAADIVPVAATAPDPPRHEETIGDRDLRDWRSRTGRRLLRIFATLVIRGERIWRGWSLHLTVLAILLVGGALATAVAEAAADVYEAGRMANPVLSASVLFPDTGGEANQIGFGLAQDFTDVLLLRSRSRLADGEYARARELIGAKALALAADTEAAHVRVVGSWQLIAMREAVAQAATVSAARCSASVAGPSWAAPASPPVAMTTTTRSPAAVSRAIVPPVKMASSSG